MNLDIELVDAEQRTIAAVRARLAMADIPAKIFPLMDRVWAFIRNNGIEGFGHNIWLYGMPSGGEVDVEIGVQVPEAFEASDDIVCSHTPAGKAARAIHRGDYAELPRVNQALVSWCHENGQTLAGRCWEIYGDWAEDPAKRRTEVYHLVAG
ncbi:MAG: GyrI-like domain-containing protein [Gammaproteobacteria bacterium]|nr:GyrI-like domain-containing protein [Gammaproteobacteria bacterium]